MFITHEQFRAQLANLMDDDLSSWRAIKHNSAFSWWYVCNEFLVPSENGVVAETEYLMMYHPFNIDALIDAQGDRGRVLSVLFMKPPAEGTTHYQPCVVNRILRFKSKEGMPRHAYEIESQEMWYSHGRPKVTDELEVVFDAGNIREF